MPGLTPFQLSVLAGVLVGQVIFHGAVAALRRTGHAAIIEARLDAMIGRGFDTVSAFVRSELALMALWVFLTVGMGSLYMIGMMRS